MNFASNEVSEVNSVASLDEMLWSTSQQSRVLQDLRRDISLVWEDEAAREINSRYLNPHETDDVTMRTELNEQADLLKQAERKLVESSHSYSQASDLSRDIAERSLFTNQDLEDAYSSYDVFVQYNSDARSKFPAIRQLIDAANSACE